MKDSRSILPGFQERKRLIEIMFYNGVQSPPKMRLTSHFYRMLYQEAKFSKTEK